MRSPIGRGVPRGACYMEHGKSDNDIDYILHTDDYEHPIDQTVRKSEYWDWKCHSSARAFGDLGVGGSQYSHWANYLEQYIQAAPPIDFRLVSIQRITC